LSVSSNCIWKSKTRLKVSKTERGPRERRKTMREITSHLRRAMTADASITVRNINLEARLRLASYSAIN